MTQAADWHANADAYLAYFDDNPDRISTAKVFPRLMGLLAELRGRRVLDFGCGQVRFSRALAAAGAQVTAHDASPAEIANARALGGDHDITYAETLEEVREAGPYDCVLCFMVLLCNPEQEADALLRTVHDLTAPGGMVGLGNTDTATIGRVWPDFYSTPPRQKERGAPYQSNIPTSAGLIQITDHYYTPEDISEMLVQAGFVDVVAEQVAEPFVIHTARRPQA